MRTMALAIEIVAVAVGASMRKTVLACAVGALVATASPGHLRAQATPADTAAVLYRVATGLEAEGRRELAEALYVLILERYRGTPSAPEVERRLAALRAGRVERSGHAELIVWSTLYGLYLGVAVPAAASAEGPTPYGLGLLLGGPAALFLSKRYAETRPMSTGQARTITFAAGWGLSQAFGWNEVLGSESAEQFFTSTIVGLLAGWGAGALVAGRGDVSAGDATLVAHAARWGTWYGLTSSALFDVQGDHAPLTWGLVGGNLGLIAGLLATPRSDMSAGRVRLISIAGVAGAVAGFGLDLIVQPEDGRVAIAIPMLASAVGLLAGARMARQADTDRRLGALTRSPSDGALVAVREGRLTLGLPAPTPTLLLAGYRHGRPRVAPGLRLTLLAASW